MTTTSDFRVSFVGSSIHEGADGEDSVTSWKATLVRYRQDGTPAPIPTGVSAWWPTKEEAAAELIQELAARLERKDALVDRVDRQRREAEKARLAAVRTAEGYQNDLNAVQVKLSKAERNLKAAALIADQRGQAAVEANAMLGAARADVRALREYVKKLKSKLKKRKKAKAEA